MQFDKFDEIKKTPAGDGNKLAVLQEPFSQLIDEIKKTPAGDGNIKLWHIG